LLNIFPFFWLDYESLTRRHDGLYFLWLVVVVPLIFIGCREVINFLLWQAVKRRLEAS
jgi:hypothetical protein